MTLRSTDLRNLQVGCCSNNVGTRLYETINTLEDKADTITVETASAGAKIELPEATANGTSKVIFQAPASLTANRTITIPDADADLTEIAANTLKTAMLTRELAAAGGKIEMLEGTDNGANKVTMQAPAAITSDRTITVPDADVDLAEVAANTLKTAMLTREVAAEGGKIDLLEGTDNGTNKVTMQAPAAITSNRTITVPDADVDLTEVAANTLKTTMLTREITTSGGKIELLEGTDNGTSKVTLQAPAALTADRTITVPDADVDLTEVPANTLKTAMLTREVAASGGKIELLEGTDNGTDKVIFQAPAALTANRTITIPDADVNLTYLDQDVGVGASPSLAKVTVTDTAGSAVGTVAAEEQGTAGRKVVLTFTDETVAVVDAPGVTGYLGLKIYDLPEGLINFQGATANLAITKDSAGVDDDWNGDFGVGTITAAGTTPLAGAEQDLIPTTATPQAVAGATTARGASTDTEANVIHDGVTTAKDVYLNILVDDADQDVTSTPCNFILNGTVTLCYTQCGDF